MWLQLNSRFAPWTVVFLLTLLTATSHTASSQSQTLGRGVVVEDVAPNSAGEKAGVRPGDVLLSWIRTAASPASADEARGEIDSPFDLAEIEIEQAPRGEMRMFATRDGGSFSVVVPPGAWGIGVRPQLAEPTRSAYQKAKELVSAPDIDKGVAAWRGLASEVNRADDWELATWLLFKVGETLASARRSEEAHAAYQAAVDVVEERDEPTAIARIRYAEGTTLERQNNFPKAEAAYRAALQILEGTSQKTLALAATLTKLGFVALARGDLSGGEQFLRRSIAIQEALAPESLAAAASLSGLGRVTTRQGNLAVAESLHKRSLAIKEKLAV